MKLITTLFAAAMMFAITGCSDAGTVQGPTVDEAVICTACGWTKNSDKCCNPSTGARCKKCKLAKGSPGCCNPDVIPEIPVPEKM